LPGPKMALLVRVDERQAAASVDPDRAPEPEGEAAETDDE